MKYYINRDVSWMDFNSRILREGMRPDIPLMERLGFLGIYSNNLDEFFRVRVATLNHLTQLSKAYYKEREEARQALEQINRANKQQNADFEQAVSRLFGELDRQHIHLINEQQLTPDQQSYVRQFFDSELNGVIHPQWLDCAKNLEENADDNGYLAIRMEHTDGKSGKKHCDYAVIQLSQTPRGRFIRLLSEAAVNRDVTAIKATIYRADVIVPAAEIFLIIARSIAAQTILVPNVGLVDGIIADLFEEDLKRSTALK